MFRHQILRPLGCVMLLGALGALRIHSATENAVYSSVPAVFVDTVAGTTILLVIALAAAWAGVPLVLAFRQRWPAHLRTRVPIGRWLMATAAARAFAVGLIVAATMLVWGALVFWRVSASPGIINASGYGTPSQVAESVDAGYPLFALTGHSIPAYIALSALWAGLHAAVITLGACLSAVLVPSRVLAVLLPAGILLLVSFAAELLSLPWVSPFITWVHPGGLTTSHLGLTLLPGLLAAGGIMVALCLLARRSPTLPRFS